METHSIQLLPLGTCLLRWHHKVDSLWHQTPRIRVTRTITKGPRAGVEETITRRGARVVVDGCKATGEVLLKAYRRRVERMMTSSFLFNMLVTDTGIVMPSILVDARQLMQQRSLTERTMRNHLAQLLQIGFIVKKKWHGRQRSFELWINPEYILLAQKPAAECAQPVESQNPTMAPVLCTNGTKFPVIELPEHQKDQKREIGQCGEIPADDPSKRPFQEAEGRNPVENVRQASKQTTGGRGAAEVSENTPVENDPAAVEKRAWEDAYVDSAWAYCKPLLYPAIHFTPHQEQLARQALRTGVYRNFDDQCFDYERYHRGVLRRLELVEKYFQKNAGRYYAPMPWAEFVKGRGYFDWENEKGFKGTMAWLQADQRAEHLARVNRTVNKAVSELTLRRKLDRGEKTTRRPARHIQEMSLMGLFRHHQRVLEQLGGPLALDKYHQRVQNLLN